MNVYFCAWFAHSQTAAIHKTIDEGLAKN